MVGGRNAYDRRLEEASRHMESNARSDHECRKTEEK